jgi:hypothetical protein
MPCTAMALKLSTSTIGIGEDEDDAVGAILGHPTSGLDAPYSVGVNEPKMSCL